MGELIQIHWQDKSDPEGATRFVAQKEIEEHWELSALLRELGETHPPPEGHCFILHTEMSSRFLRTKKEGEEGEEEEEGEEGNIG